MNPLPRLHFASTAGPVLLPDGTSFPFWDDLTTYTRTYHVAQSHPAATDAGDGTPDRPFKTISAAIARVQPREKVIIHAGIYRETLRPARGGTSADAMIAIEAAPGESVIVRGSETLATPPISADDYHLFFPPAKRPVWQIELPPEWFVFYHPFMINNLPRSRHFPWQQRTAAELHRTQLRRGHVYLDGVPLRQVYLSQDLAENTGVFWVQDPGLRLFFRPLNDIDPRNATIEVTTREQCFAPAANLAYIRLSGITFEHAADGIPFPQRAMVSTAAGHHFIIEDCTLRHANAMAMDIGLQDPQRRDPTGPVGHHIVRRNHISDTGIGGICGLAGVDASLIEDNLIENVGTLDLEHVYEAAAIKLHVAKHVLIRRNIIRHITNACGIWLDYECSHNRVTANLIADIQTLLAGVYIEANPEPNCVDGNIIANLRDVPTNTPPKDGIPGGIGISSDVSDGTIIAHNLLLDIRGHYAIAAHLAQKGRVMNRRAALCRGHRIVGNILVRCPKRILLARLTDNLCEANLFDAANARASLAFEDHDRIAALDLPTWQHALAQDQGSVEVALTVDLDVDALLLRATGQPALPKVTSTLLPPAVAYPSGGPLSPAQWANALAATGLSLLAAHPAR